MAMASRALGRARGTGSRGPRALTAAGEAQIRPVESRRDLAAFIRLPWKLYEGQEHWIPPLISERRKHLSRSENPFFEHAQAEYFLAWRGNRPVGRISAHIDRRLNEFQHNSWGLFGFFECENDPETAAGLIDTAAEWLRGRGCDRLVGPLDFSTNHECGVLVSGHDLDPQILENWHHPYYAALLEQAGLQKAMDLLKWQILVAEPERVLPVIYELADTLEEREGIRMRNMRKRDFQGEVRRFMEVYNSAWERNWGFVPLTDNELTAYARELKPILDESYALIAEKDDEVVGAALTLPDMNKILRRLNGRLLPFGWARFLLERRKVDELRVFALGVKREYRHTGTAAAFYAEHWRECLRRKIVRVETGWILESNEPMNRAMQALGGDIVKRYRIYERPFPVGADDGAANGAGASADDGLAPLSGIA
jgi:GNAT superfamily N-acetyltransferase